jgi:hypothetical protein
VTDRIATLEIGFFGDPAVSGELTARVRASEPDGARTIAFDGDGQRGFIRFAPRSSLSPLPASTERELAKQGSWTRYEVRAGTQRMPLEGLRALVLSEEDAFRKDVEDADYERWVDSEWGPGVTRLPNYGAAFLLRGASGTRSGKYASIGFFTDRDARERLLVALGDRVPPELLQYRQLIDIAFGKYLERGRRRFFRLDAVDA